MSNVNSNRGAGQESVLQGIYRPILLGYFGVFATYYLVMMPFNYWDLVGWERASMLGAGGLAIAICIFGLVYIRKPVPVIHIDLTMVALNIVVTGNVVLALEIAFAPAKMIYFIILAMVFSLASLNFRQSFVSIVIAAVAFMSFYRKLAGEDLATYGYLAFAAAMASLTIAYYLRNAIRRIAHAKEEAEDKRREAVAAGEEMRARSLSDSLTALPNRRAFFEFLREARGRADESLSGPGKPEHIWLILVDLDGFKAVNDIHGHRVGDLLLQQVAGRLETAAGDDIHVSRMGGDEFNLIAIGPHSLEEIEARCKTLLEAIAENYVIDGRHVRISCSIGCKQLDLNQPSQAQLTQADYALMVAKSMGKNQFVMFNAEHAKAANERLEIERALRGAKLEREIDLVFQPQFALDTHDITRVEVLARWTSPRVGKVEPSRFVEIAERSGLITGITLVVVQKALDHLTQWEEILPVSINISGLDLISSQTIEQIIALVEKADVDPCLIEFEVTETAMMTDMAKASANLERLSDAGFFIALDDFGTGYSNFSYLRSLPISKLKVDRSFLNNPEDPTTQKVLTSVAGMARVLGVHCLLEGVEDEVALLMAKRAGAQSVQGFLFAKPMPSAELKAFVERALSKEDEKRLSA